MFVSWWFMVVNVLNVAVAEIARELARSRPVIHGARLVLHDADLEEEDKGKNLVLASVRDLGWVIHSLPGGGAMVVRVIDKVSVRAIARATATALVSLGWSVRGAPGSSTRPSQFRCR